MWCGCVIFLKIYIFLFSFFKGCIIFLNSIFFVSRFFLRRMQYFSLFSVSVFFVVVVVVVVVVTWREGGEGWAMRGLGTAHVIPAAATNPSPANSPNMYFWHRRTSWLVDWIGRRADAVKIKIYFIF